MLDNNLDWTIGEQQGYTCMHGASFQGRAEVAKVLLAHGLDGAHRHSDGYPAFHRACWGREQKHVDTVKVFLDAGVDMSVSSDNGHTCISLAKERGHQATADMITKHLTHLNNQDSTKEL